MICIENLDFDLLLKCLQFNKTYVDAEIKILFDTESLNDVVCVLKILIDLGEISDYELGLDWTLRVRI